MKRLLVILVFTMIISILIFSSCKNPTETNTAKTIKFSYTMPKGEAIAKGFDWFGPAFEKATNFRYKVEIYPGGKLHPGNAALSMAKSGAVEMVYTSAGTNPGQFPLTMVSAIPSLGFPQNTLKMYVASNEAFRELVNTTTEIQIEFKDITLVQTFLLAPYKLVAKKTQIKSPSDLKGLKVGGTGAQMEIVKANGGASVQEIPVDSYLDMDKGITDASFVTFSQVHDFKLYGIANFFLDHNFGNASSVIIMNSAFYNSMGAADQKVLLDTWAQAQEICAQGSLDDIETGKNDITTAGKNVYIPTEAEEAVWDKQATLAINSWRAEAKLKGSTDTTLDAVLAKWKAIHSKYLVLGAE